MKKNGVMIFTVIFFLLGLMAGHSGYAADRSKAAEIDIQFKVSAAKLKADSPSSMFFYRCAMDRSSQNQKASLKEFFGQSSFMEIREKSGGIFAADMKRLWASRPKMNDDIKRMGKREALQKTDDFLKRVKGTPVESIVKRFSEDKMKFIKKDQEESSLPMGWNVTYRRVLKNYEVVGPGGKIKTYLNTNGDIVGYIRIWRELSPEKEAPIISPDKAVEKFKKDPIGTALLSNVEKIEVTDIKLAYLELGISASQNYLQPIYLFRAMAYSKGRGDKLTELPYTRYIAALADPPEALWPKGRDHKPGKRTGKKFKAGEDD